MITAQPLKYLSAVVTRCLQNAGRLNTMSMKLFNMTIPPIPVSEDCLYLSIYSPAYAHEGSNLPVSTVTWDGRMFLL